LISWWRTTGIDCLMVNGIVTLMEMGMEIVTLKLKATD
jgi:hypothetical protein